MTAPVFVQGMRRSGTTILYDLLYEDPSLTCFYEPLAAERPAVGGGSGLRDVDLFAEVRRLRGAFAARHPELEDVSLLNYGAPRDWRLEFEPELPELLREYLRFLIGQDEAVALKFTRMSCKVPVLAEIAPDSRLVHVVRDPRAVAVSYLFGRHHRRREELAAPDCFFERTSDWTQWSSYEFSQHLLGEARLSSPLRDFERILLIWRHTFEATHRGASEAFGERCTTVRNEDLREQPVATMRRLYAFLERPLPPAVERFATVAVQPHQTLVAPLDPRWEEAYERLGMGDAVRAAGYL
jgi:Sulfotransferase family